MSRSPSSLCRSCRIFLYNSRRYCNSSTGGSGGNEQPITGTTSSRQAGKPSVSVTDDAVQRYLTQLTGMDFDKVFKPHRESLVLPKYELLTEGELIHLYKETVKRAREKLKMDPIMSVREDRGKEREKDERLDKFDYSKWLFTDISMDKDDKERYIVVREPTGTLRDATWEEMERVCQMYMPKIGKKVDIPTMLKEEHLPKVLERDFHLHVLEVVSIQCDPDSKDYIRVHQTVYEDIDKRRLYDKIHSTKFYGAMIWYLIERQQINQLLTHYISNRQFEDAEQLVQLYLLCYPSLKFKSGDSGSIEALEGLALLEAFCKYYGLYKPYEIVLQEKKSLTDSESTLLSASG